MGRGDRFAAPVFSVPVCEDFDAPWPLGAAVSCRCPRGHKVFHQPSRSWLCEACLKSLADRKKGE